MGPLIVVAMQPVCRRHVPDFLQGVKDIAVQHFGAIRPVESLVIGVLCWLARLNVIEGNALGLGPLGQRMGNEFRAVVQARMDSGAPRTSTSSFKARMTLAAGKLVSISMRSASRLNSSITLKVWYRRPDHSASDMKSQLQP